MKKVDLEDEVQRLYVCQLIRLYEKNGYDKEGTIIYDPDHIGIVDIKNDSELKALKKVIKEFEDNKAE